MNLADQVQTTASNTARVTIVNSLAFTKPLQNAIVREGDRFEWSVEVSGGMLPLTYEWQMQVDDGTKALVWVDVLDDATHDGTDTDTLEFTKVSFDDEGTYRVNVSDSGNQQISSSAQLVVENALPAGGMTGLVLAAMLTALGGATALRRRK